MLTRPALPFGTKPLPSSGRRVETKGTYLIILSVIRYVPFVTPLSIPRQPINPHPSPRYHKGRRDFPREKALHFGKEGARAGKIPKEIDRRKDHTLPTYAAQRGDHDDMDRQRSPATLTGTARGGPTGAIRRDHSTGPAVSFLGASPLPRTRPPISGIPKAGRYAGRLIVSADFDEPLDELREYME